MVKTARRVPLVVPIAALALVCPVIAGCGGGSAGESEEGEASTAEVAEPKEDISAYADRIATALTSPDCEGLEEINDPEKSGFLLPCPADKAQTRRAFEGFKVLGSASYGSGAVIDYTDGEAPDGATYIATLNEDRDWYIDAGLVTKQLTVGTKIENQAGFDKVLDDFLGAVRDGDCEEFFRTSVTSSQDPETVCKKELPLYDGLEAALKESEGAEPVLLGGNRSFVFYGLTTDRPEKAYRTATVQKTGEGSTEPYLVRQTTVGPLPE